VTAAVTIFCGTLASFDYHSRNMRTTAPTAWATIAAAVEPPVKWAVGLLGGR
jgi:hypothetical protein